MSESGWAQRYATHARLHMRCSCAKPINSDLNDPTSPKQDELLPRCGRTPAASSAPRHADMEAWRWDEHAWGARGGWELGEWGIAPISCFALLLISHQSSHICRAKTREKPAAHAAVRASPSYLRITTVSFLVYILVLTITPSVSL
jgi:hypothetical protein